MKLICFLVLVTSSVLLYVHRSEEVEYPCHPAAPCGCSINSASINRIVGGEVAPSSTWGWVVSIKQGSSGLCGGTIIATRWILTAAHCVYSYAASELRVYAGSEVVWLGQLRSVSNVIMHFKYNMSTKQNDIALLYLSSALDITDPNVKIACIPSVSALTLLSREWPPPNVDVVAVGWGGISSNESMSTSLRQVMMSTIAASGSMCRSILNDWSRQFCAGAQCGGRDTCQGDIVGPIMMFTTSSQWTVVGIASYGIGCGLPSYASVNTRIAYYQSWISSMMSGTVPVNPDSSEYRVSTSISSCNTTSTHTTTNQIIASMSSDAHLSYIVDSGFISKSILLLPLCILFVFV